MIDSGDEKARELRACARLWRVERGVPPRALDEAERRREGGGEGESRGEDRAGERGRVPDHGTWRKRNRSAPLAEPLG